MEIRDCFVVATCLWHLWEAKLQGGKLKGLHVCGPDIGNCPVTLAAKGRQI
jgi:hypothetical protein